MLEAPLAADREIPYKLLTTHSHLSNFGVNLI